MQALRQLCRNSYAVQRVAVPMAPLKQRSISTFPPLSAKVPVKPSFYRVATAGLSPHPGSRHAQKRLGRGPSSGRGGTSTRGHKGQKSRSGYSAPFIGWEGGQTPITARFPKRGFTNPTAREWAPVNVDRIQFWIDQGRLPSASTSENPITAFHLLSSRCVHQVKDGVKLLGDGLANLTSPLHIVVSRASKSAIAAVEKAGGSVVCTYYNKLALSDLVKGRTDRKAAAPIRKDDILWYSDSRNRGYLSPRVKGDEEGMKVEIEARSAKSRALRRTQPDVAYPVFKLEDMLEVPKHAQSST